jgi:hypothetical protein
MPTAHAEHGAFSLGAERAPDGRPRRSKAASEETACRGLFEQTMYADKQHYTCEDEEPQPTEPRRQWFARGRATKTSHTKFSSPHTAKDSEGCHQQINYRQEMLHHSP